jgi:hypothetical protein
LFIFLFLEGIRFHEEELSPKNMHSLKANTSFNELKNTNINDYQIGRKIGIAFLNFV